MQVKAILFDIDGTLVDSNDLHVLAWREAFENIGMNFSGPKIHAQIGKGADMLIPALVPDLDAATCQELGKLQGGIFRRKYRASVKPFRHAFELLAHSSECQQQVVLASSASQDDLSHYMDELKIRELVAATTSGGEVENTKPSPDIFSTALAKLKDVTTEEVMVVGDSPYDVEAARKIGISTVALRSGGFADELLRNAGAIAIYDDVAALLSDYANSPLGHHIE